MRVAVIPPGGLPIPSVRGGAVEALITTLIVQNEARVDPDEITVFSIQDDAAHAFCQQYRHCKIAFVEVRGGRFRHLMYRIANRLSKRYYGNGFINALRSQYDLGAFDRVVVENMPEYGLLTGVPASEQVLHMHNELSPGARKRWDSIQSRYGRVFVVSDFIGDGLAAITDSVRTQVRTVHNGIDVNMFRGAGEKSRRESRARLSLSDDEVVVLYVGRLTRDKGVLELIQAFAQLDARYHDARLIVVGASGFQGSPSTRYVRTIERIAAKCSRIHILGYVAPNALPAIYSIADVGVVPSIWDEPFCLALLEHMAAGIPTIVSSVGGMTEIATRESSLFVRMMPNGQVALHEAICTLINNPELRRSMGASGTERANQFSAGRYASCFFENLR